MKKFKQFALLLFAAVVVFGCSKYDDTELRNDVSDLQSRVEKLEKWCETTNTQISALQGVVTALEAKDYVTGVTPITVGAETVGYTITFSKSGAVTIKNGVNGKDGVNGITPLIGTAKHTDGLYYWTVKSGEADGNMIRTTADKGETPALSVAADTDGKLYWQVDGKWLLNGTDKVPATGEKGETGADGVAGDQGDAIFKKDGIDLTDPDNVTFTLADGTTKISLPRTSEMKIFDSFDDFKVAMYADLTLALNIKEGDYKAIKAELTSMVGITTDIKTRAASVPWLVKITAPTFKADGNIETQPVVNITAPLGSEEGDIALLKVTIIDSKGSEHAATRVLFHSTKVDVVDIESVTTAETLDLAVNEEQTLTATVLPAEADQTVTWTTSDESVATVSADGKVKGIKAGTATIKVASTTDATKFSECTVTVNIVEVTGVTLDGDKTILIGETVKLVPTITPANATNQEVTWSLSSGAVGLTADGSATGIFAAETIITVTTKDGNKTATCKVTVKAKPTITWATGNLVADGPNGAKIGTKTDAGLYFQFGSLVGWSSTGSPAIAVSPTGYTGSTTWNSSWTGDPATEDAAAGTGDPCKYYLKGTWRLPTTDEYVELFKNSGYPSTGPWKRENSSATNSTIDLTFPASGDRLSYDGSLRDVGTNGYYWSSSPFDDDYGYNLAFDSSWVQPSFSVTRATGLPVRCVQEK